VGGVGVVALGGGIFMGLSAKGQESSARDKCKTFPALGLVCPDSARSDLDSAKSKAGLANVLMIAGGVATAGGLVMILVGGPTASSGSASLSLSPLLGPRDAGLFATGSF
jgi:hypothetical protein